MIPKSKHEVIFTTRMNIIYHEKRESFYSKFINWTGFASLIFSSAAFAALGDIFSTNIPKEQVIGILATIIACLNGAVLAFGMLENMKVHSTFKMKWMDILAKAQSLKTDSEDDLKNLANDIIELSSTEPPPKDKILNLAYKKTCTAMGLKCDEKV